MSYNQRRGVHRDVRWEKKHSFNQLNPVRDDAATAGVKVVTNTVGALNTVENSRRAHVGSSSNQFLSVSVPSPAGMQRHKASQKPMVWKPKSCGTLSGDTRVHVENAAVDEALVEIQRNGAESASFQKSAAHPIELNKGLHLDRHNVENCTHSLAKIRAAFYPKFENENSGQAVRVRMIEMVSKGLATLEVSLKHSGSLFMYAGPKGGAYVENGYGNIYTAVGVFILGQIFRSGWGTEARKKQAEFNDFVERNHLCISMVLVTAVLGDHGQRPLEDYVVVTAITDLGNGKPEFYSILDIIAFCRKWHLPTNHVWLFSSRNSVTSFFAAYDALCEEGTTTPVCKVLDEIADIFVPGATDHIKMQGEILEGLVARLVSCDRTLMEKVLRDFPPPPLEKDAFDLGPSLREICTANRSDEKQIIKELLHNVGTSFCPNYLDWFGNEAGDVHSRNADKSVVSKFLQAHPIDDLTSKLQDMIHSMREMRYPVSFECFHNFHKVDCLSSENLSFRIIIHVPSDSAFQIHKMEMRSKAWLWPLYRGFTIDINLFKANKDTVAETAKKSHNLVERADDNSGTWEKRGLADEDANLIIKLKFLPYKLRTILIRNGLSICLKKGRAAYKAYYLRQMKNWCTSSEKQWEISKMLDEWAVYIQRKYLHKQLSSSLYLSEAEPFLEQYANRSPENQSLIGCAGNFVKSEDFLTFVEDRRDEKGELEKVEGLASSFPNPSTRGTMPKHEGLIIFFAAIPGSSKSGLCREILNAPGGLGDGQSIRSLMGDYVRALSTERYWQKFADEFGRNPHGIMLADKNAPNEEVWSQIEDVCRRTRVSAIPVVPDSEGTASNPFSLEALAIFMSRVLQRNHHPGYLDKASPNAGYVVLMFYHINEGKSRKDFDAELLKRFGSLVKVPLLKLDRSPLPDPVKSALEQGIKLYKLHSGKHGSLESIEGSYAKDWIKWEQHLQEIISGHAEYLNSIQVPFEVAVKQVLEQLRTIVKGEYTTPTNEKKFGVIAFAAVSLPVSDVKILLKRLAENPDVRAFLRDRPLKTSLMKTYVTLAHKQSHGVTSVARYGMFLNQKVPVDLSALLFGENMAALEACLGSIDGEKITSKYLWPHLVLWTKGVAAEEANMLPQLHSEGKATRIDISPPITILGTLEYH